MTVVGQLAGRERKPLFTIMCVDIQVPDIFQVHTKLNLSIWVLKSSTPRHSSIHCTYFVIQSIIGYKACVLYWWYQCIYLCSSKIVLPCLKYLCILDILCNVWESMIVHMNWCNRMDIFIRLWRFINQSESRWKVFEEHCHRTSEVRWQGSILVFEACHEMYW